MIRKKYIVFIIILILLGIIFFNFNSEDNSNNYLNKSNLIYNLSFDNKNNIITPVNLNANYKTKQLLNYFYKLSNKSKIEKKRIISGQFIGTANYNLLSDYNLNIVYLKNQTGKTPLLFGVDYGWEEMNLKKILFMNKFLINNSKKGGLTMVSFSLSNPFTKKGLRSFGSGDYNYTDLFKIGTIPNTNFKSDLKIIAKGLKDLEKNNVTVLIRPFQEMNGDWFWWSYGNKNRLTQKEFKKIWIYTFNYFNYEQNLSNLLWVYSSQYIPVYENNILPVNYYYPGHNYSDIVGFSYYGDNVLEMNFTYNEMLKIGKPLVLAEFGPSNTQSMDNLELLKVLKNKYTKFVYFMYWSGWTSYGFRVKKAIIEQENSNLFLNDELILTREDLK